ncbi:nicotinate phosphoribosyltransferase [Malassezia cuniculi]|uniref:Nicotinate phosphoribosyltransferase n=1 Tax=Malassezia cuniculi TaxID=948313 RepID=A0AAF0EQE9_9BASI|nr:nicotinate phosphoribosyltransferase [Malassezia cuniculi]
MSSAAGGSVANNTPAPVRLPSLLDTDLYKLTMQQAVLRHFYDAKVTYKFTNRNKKMRFTPGCVAAIKDGIDHLSSLRLTREEREWLQATCPYLRTDYLDYLEAFRYVPNEQVAVHFEQDEDGLGSLSLEVFGYWRDVIMYEVPVMAIISEAYFVHVDTDWSGDDQESRATSKGEQLFKGGVMLSEFGTRRRRSYATQDSVIKGLIAAAESAPQDTSYGRLLGTSNVHLARIHNLLPVGTIAHEWTMGIAGLSGYTGVNRHALHLWDQVYQPPAYTPKGPADDLTIALTDTFSTRVFWDDLLADEQGVEMLRRWRGLRQDSGDSRAFVQRAVETYRKIGVDPGTKLVVFSDGLDVPRCLELLAYSREAGIRAGFGVGTNLTNDFVKQSDPTAKSPPLNMVIKLDSINGHHTVKISDELTKNTGDPDEVAYVQANSMVKRRFGLAEVEDA